MPPSPQPATLPGSSSIPIPRTAAKSPAERERFSSTRAPPSIYPARLRASPSHSPYVVINSLGAEGSTTGTDLQGVNGGLGAHYALGSNIDASATSAWNGGAGFMPIGSNTAPFTGTFDGLGHAISNLTINLPSMNYVGLFGVLGSAGVIRNTGLLGGSVQGGAYFVGGLVGL